MLWNNNYNIVESIDQKLNRGGVPPLTVDYLVVGGGGAGRVQVSGEFSYAGGGGGGFVTSSLTLSFNTKFNIVVGAGAIASSANNGIGGLSSFSGTNFGTPINIIASGGYTSTGDSGAPQNNIAGTGSVCAGSGRYYGGGGGGGMRTGSSVDCLAVPVAGGDGGDALAWYSGSFAGGGGGGVIGLAGETPLGGSGGGSANGPSGGSGGSFTTPTGNPVQNSGGGGGGNGNNNQLPATNGASGSVIIRYPYIPAEFAVPYATGGTITIYDGYVYHRFNSSGTFETFAR